MPEAILKKEENPNSPSAEREDKRASDKILNSETKSHKENDRKHKEDDKYRGKRDSDRRK